MLLPFLVDVPVMHKMLWNGLFKRQRFDFFCIIAPFFMGVPVEMCENTLLLISRVCCVVMRGPHGAFHAICT